MSIGMLILKVCHLASRVVIFVGSKAYILAGLPLVLRKICSIAKLVILTSIWKFNTVVLK